MISCSSLDKISLSGKLYENKNHHMGGYSYIKFLSDTTFLIVERNGLFYTKGNWQLKGNKILLNFIENIEKYKGDTASIYFKPRKSVIEVINRKKLRYKSVVYIKE